MDEFAGQGGSYVADEAGNRVLVARTDMPVMDMEPLPDAQPEPEPEAQPSKHTRTRNREE